MKNNINIQNIVLSEDAKTFLRSARGEFEIDEILRILESLRDIKIIVLGDAILDQYVSCDFMEKSGKEPIVATKFVSSEIYAGGIFAVANTIAEFVNNATLVTCIGKDYESFARGKLNKKINVNIYTKPKEKTIIKKRYIDDYRKHKLFEIYNTDYFSLDKKTEDKIIKYLKKNLKNFDMILVADFGHGLITENIKRKIIQSGKFLAINTQLNSGNLGYNFITKYPQADFVLLNERELRLPIQERDSDIKTAIKKLSDQISFNKINITQGKYGSIYYSGDKYYRAPAFTEEALDTIGAGDAVLSLTSLLAYKDVNPKIIPFLGNCIGALSVKIMGNKRPVYSRELKKFVISILE